MAGACYSIWKPWAIYVHIGSGMRKGKGWD
ncbi:hypothetical protein CCACVL1_06740 [Corchorus capsularis]|uniref:Uncharacterized protein n=1 Tax=Corchorus capsularis TaxID=210143 RepID=A0A1R3JDF3_COCAP|nr:hypothetical protein CCACVL1_06740 [Corchorus capsularis]